MSSIALQAVSGADGQRPPKRRRDDGAQADGASAREPEVVKSTRFWFPDGTVVIQAEDMQFRVHWGIMSARSEVFADMFRMPQPEDEPSVEGCPLVVVHDSAKDWEVMLEVFYYSRPGNTLSAELTQTMSLLRLGKKYAVTDLADCALKEVEVRLNKFNIEKGVGSIRGMSKEAMYTLAVLTEELDIESLLHALYYSCLSFLTLLEIADGYTGDDNCKLTLPPQFRRAILMHRDEFFRVLRDRVGHLTRPNDDQSLVPVLDCVAPEVCTAAYRTASRGWVANGVFDAFGALATVPGLCETCNTRISAMRFNVFLRFYTSDVVRIFGLPPYQWNF